MNRRLMKIINFQVKTIAIRILFAPIELSTLTGVGAKLKRLSYKVLWHNVPVYLIKATL